MNEGENARATAPTAAPENTPETPPSLLVEAKTPKPRKRKQANHPPVSARPPSPAEAILNAWREAHGEAAPLGEWSKTQTAQAAKLVNQGYTPEQVGAFTRDWLTRMARNPRWKKGACPFVFVMQDLARFVASSYTPNQSTQNAQSSPPSVQIYPIDLEV